MSDLSFAHSEEKPVKSADAFSSFATHSSSVPSNGLRLPVIQAAGNMAIQRAIQKENRDDLHSENALRFSPGPPVNIRSDPDAVTFLRRNQAVAATLDASTIMVDPAYRGSHKVLMHEYAHIAQLRSGLITSRDASERAAHDYALGTRTYIGGAATPPLFQRTINIAGGTDPLAAEVEARKAAEEQDLANLGISSKASWSKLFATRLQDELPKQGAQAANVSSIVAVGGLGAKFELNRDNLFHVTVGAAGSKGSIESATDYSFHMDPEQRYAFEVIGPATGPTGPTMGPIVDTTEYIEGKADDTALALMKPVALYPVILRYEQWFRLSDRYGRTCMVQVESTVQFSYETWESVTAGRTPSLETLQALEGDTAFTGVSIDGYGPVQTYKVGALSNARSIDAGIKEIEAFLEAGDSLKDAAGLPMTFIRPGQTAGVQFSTLEAVLAQLDEKELERRAKLQVVQFTGGDADALPPSVRGVLSTLEKALLVFAAVLVGAALLAELPFITFGMALVWIGASLLATAFATSLISRIQEAAQEGIYNPASVLSASILDAIGAGQLYEAITDRSLLSGRELNRTEEERWESGSAGLLNLIMTVLGVRSAAKNYSPRPLELVPDELLLEDHPGMDLWTEGYDPSPQVVTQLNQARCTIGEQGIAFSGYPHNRGWAFLEGPSGAGGHAWNQPGFDGVAFRVSGPFEIEIIDNKAFASTRNVSSASAITRNLETNLGDLSAQIANPVYDVVPRIAEARSSIAAARTALQNGTPLPPEIRLIVTNFGGRSSGITAALEALGITFRESN